MLAVVVNVTYSVSASFQLVQTWAVIVLIICNILPYLSDKNMILFLKLHFLLQQIKKHDGNNLSTSQFL